MPCDAGWKAPKRARFLNNGSRLNTAGRPRIVSAQVGFTPDRSMRFSHPGRMDMTGYVRRIGMGVLASIVGCGLAVAQGWQHVGKVQRVEKRNDGVELTAGAAKVRLTVFREGVFRVRVAPNGAFPKDFSWAVIESSEAPAFTVNEDQKEVRVSAGNTVAIVEKSPLLINFSDTA